MAFRFARSCLFKTGYLLPGLSGESSWVGLHAPVHRRFDSRTPTGSHYFGNIHCRKEIHERKTATSVSNAPTHAHWLQYRNSDFRFNSLRRFITCLSGQPRSQGQPLLAYCSARGLSRPFPDNHSWKRAMIDSKWSSSSGVGGRVYSHIFPL